MMPAFGSGDVGEFTDAICQATGVEIVIVE
jgi:hypothetical protein